MTTTTLEHLAYARTDSPVGRLLLARDAAGLRLVSFEAGVHRVRPGKSCRLDERAFADVIGQLQAYFAGELKRFHLQLAPEGTAFQRKVWQALDGIPYGETLTYGELAVRISNRRASRAVGAATGRNPLAIVIPCHRVVGAGGALTGFGGGLTVKAALLALERAHR